MYGVEFLNTKLNVSDPQVSFTLNSIKDATRRANEIIKDLLDFASLSKLQIKPENFNAVIDQALNLIKHQIDKQRIHVFKKFNPVLPAVRIDANRMEQVLLDLTLNAVHAMPDGGELIITTSTEKFLPKEAGKGTATTLAGRERFREGDQLVIVDIDDTGVGIQEENIGKIFDPFFTTRRAAGGVGLGLSIARTIVKNHGGFIGIENRLGGGVRARLVFRAEKKGGE
jgi:two-component system, NtrC family, sensor kinase